MEDRDKLSELARYEIEDLIAEGIQPTPDEIVELSGIGWRLETESTRLYLSRGRPVDCENVRLWPMMLQARDWYKREGAEMKGREKAALGFAMAHCYGGDDVFYLSGDKAEQAVIDWQASVAASEDALTVAISQVLMQEEAPDDPPPLKTETSTKMEYGDLSAQLVTLCGQTPEYWERKCSHEYAMAVFYAVINHANETGRKLDTHPQIIAQRQMMWAVEQIRKRHAKEQQADG